MVLETTKNLIHKSICGKKITDYELMQALLKEYEAGLNVGIEITSSKIIALILELKKGS